MGQWQRQDSSVQTDWDRAVSQGRGEGCSPAGCGMVEGWELEMGRDAFLEDSSARGGGLTLCVLMLQTAVCTPTSHGTQSPVGFVLALGPTCTTAPCEAGWACSCSLSDAPPPVKKGLGEQMPLAGSSPGQTDLLSLVENCLLSCSSAAANENERGFGNAQQAVRLPSLPGSTALWFNFGGVLASAWPGKCVCSTL